MFGGFFGGAGRGMEIFPGNLFHLHFIPKSVCSALPCFPSLAHTSAPETARNSSQATPSHGSGVERRDSWASARSSCSVSLLVTEISWEDRLFISLDPKSPDLRRGGGRTLARKGFSLSLGLIPHV